MKPKENKMWMTKDWTHGESNALVKKLGGDEVARGILNGTVKFTVTEMPKVATDPHTFFQSHPGLFVSDSFRNLVVAKAGITARAVEAKPFNLPRNMLDSEIEVELGEGHVWEKGVLLATLADMLTKQEGGKVGELLNNGYANLFYTSSCVVYVYWDAGRRGWSVAAWRRGDDGWDAGNRAFYPAT